jgi:hypothetical protein
MLYAARRADAPGRALLVRVALPLDTLKKTLVTIRDRFLIFLLLGAVVVYLVARGPCGASSGRSNGSSTRRTESRTARTHGSR